MTPSGCIIVLRWGKLCFQKSRDFPKDKHLASDKAQTWTQVHLVLLLTSMWNAASLKCGGRWIQDFCKEELNGSRVRHRETEPLGWEWPAPRVKRMFRYHLDQLSSTISDKWWKLKPKGESNWPKVTTRRKTQPTFTQCTLRARYRVKCNYLNNPNVA